jgi:hypothetical protein
MLTCNLPAKNYVKCYLEKSFGNPVRMRKESAIGKYFYRLLEDAEDDQSSKYRDYSDCVKIEIPYHVFLKKGCVLTKHSITEFNNFVEDVIKSQMHAMLDTLIDLQGIEIKKAIDYYYDTFGFDETVFPYETIKKSYYRYRNTRDAA